MSSTNELETNYYVYSKKPGAKTAASKRVKSESSERYANISVRTSNRDGNGNYIKEDKFHVGNLSSATESLGIMAGGNLYSNNSMNELTAPFDDARTAEEVGKNIVKNSNYYMSYSNGLDMYANLNLIDRNEGITPAYEKSNNTDSQYLFNFSTEFYNRFKTANPNDVFQKGFAHVFFIRPDCNIYNLYTGLHEQFANDAVYQYAYRNNPLLIYQLCRYYGADHAFMFSLSNKAASFSLADEYITHDTYGTTYSGWKIAFGRSTAESKTSGQFEITYKDDKNLHIYHLHKLWVDYISGVYSGKYVPETKNIYGKILDYATAVYYIITAEDGETVLFWSKYYGVFPTTIPSAQYGWGYGSIIGSQPLDVTINYQYSFKEDFNPSSLEEINDASSIAVSDKTLYAPTYDKNKGHIGETWVRLPYVETVLNNGRLVYKLRFIRGNSSFGVVGGESYTV